MCDIIGLTTPPRCPEGQTPPCGTRANDSRARSMSPSVSIRPGTSSIASEGAKASAEHEVIKGGCLRVAEKNNARTVGCDLLEHSQPLAGDAGLDSHEAREVATRPCQARDETRTEWVGNIDENDRYCAGLSPNGGNRRRCLCDDQFGIVPGRYDQPRSVMKSSPLTRSPRRHGPATSVGFRARAPWRS